MKIENKIDISQNVNFKSRKIPRFLYHITTKDNYENIKKTGYI